MFIVSSQKQRGRRFYKRRLTEVLHAGLQPAVCQLSRDCSAARKLCLSWTWTGNEGVTQTGMLRFKSSPRL